MDIHGHMSYDIAGWNTVTIFRPCNLTTDRVPPLCPHCVGWRVAVVTGLIVNI